MPLQLTDLKCSALLSYCSERSSDAVIQHSKGVRSLVKNDGYYPEAKTEMSQWIAQNIKENFNSLVFKDFFQPDSILIPIPRSGLMQSGTLWVPDRVANALVKQGLGARAIPCLERTIAVPKAAYSLPKDRPSAQMNYDSLKVLQGLISIPKRILLIDDIVTSGSTAVGAANRLREAFPGAQISTFAAMRTISRKIEFGSEYSPYVGNIRLYPDGRCWRRPQ